MTNRELILKYLSNNFTQEEKNIFEQKLELDPEFKTDYNRIIVLISELDVYKNPLTDERYFNNLTIDLRKNSNYQQKNILKPAFALIGVIVFAVLVTFYVAKNSNQIVKDGNLTLSDLSQQEINYITDISPVEISVENITEEKLNQNLTDLLTEELDLNSGYIVTVFDDVESIASNISETDADKIYNELINKQFFQ